MPTSSQGHLRNPSPLWFPTNALLLPAACRHLAVRVCAQIWRSDTKAVIWPWQATPRYLWVWCLWRTSLKHSNRCGPPYTHHLMQLWIHTLNTHMHCLTPITSCFVHDYRHERGGLMRYKLLTPGISAAWICQEVSALHFLLVALFMHHFLSYCSVESR